MFFVEIISSAVVCDMFKSYLTYRFLTIRVVSAAKNIELRKV